MAERNLPDVVSQYMELLNERKVLHEIYKARDDKLLELKGKIEKWLLTQGEETVCSSDFMNEEPYVFWKINEKTIETAIRAYRDIRDNVGISNGVAAKFEKENNDRKDEIGKWIFAETERTKVKSGKTDFGSYHRKLKTQASIADLKNLVAWASENEAEDIMYKRVNSNFVTSYFDTKLEEDKELAEKEGREPRGEYPPFINVNSQYEIVVTK